MTKRQLPLKPPFEVGTCISIALPDGTFAAGIVTRKETGSAPYNILSILNYHQPTAADPSYFSKLDWLPAGAGVVLKYNLYNNGWLKSRQHYTIVDCISLHGVTIPEAKLMLGNWGNMREHLAGQVP